MPEATLAVQEIAHVLQQHEALSVFCGTLASGELAILIAFLFAGQNGAQWYAAASGAFAAVLLTDFFWFFVGRLTRRIGALRRYYAERFSARLKRVFERTFERHMLQSLIILKYIYGLRLLSLVWLGFRRDEKLPVFIAYDLVGAAAYLAVLAGVAWVANTSIGLAVSFLHIIAAASTALIVLYLLYRAAQTYFGRISGL